MSGKIVLLVKLQGRLQSRRKDWNGYRQVPWLTLSSVWLEQAGFKVGDRVEILIANKELIIKNLNGHGD